MIVGDYINPFKEKMLFSITIMLVQISQTGLLIFLYLHHYIFFLSSVGVWFNRSVLAGSCYFTWAVILVDWKFNNRDIVGEADPIFTKFLHLRTFQQKSLDCDQEEEYFTDGPLHKNNESNCNAASITCMRFIF